MHGLFVISNRLIFANEPASAYCLFAVGMGSVMPLRKFVEVRTQTAAEHHVLMICKSSGALRARNPDVSKFSGIFGVNSNGSNLGGIS